MPTEYITDHTLIDRTLLSWAEVYTGVGNGNGRWLNQVMGRPDKPYISLQMVSDPVIAMIDGEEQRYNDVTDHLDKVTYGDRSLILQVTVYDDPPTGAAQQNARSRLLGALASLRSQVVKELLSSAGLAFWRAASGVRRLDEQLGQRWEHRAQVDLEFGYTSLFTDKPDQGGDGSWIETVEPITESDGTLIIQE